MKKVIALLTTCILILSMTTVALASDKPPAPTIGNPAPNNEAYTEVRSEVSNFTSYAATSQLTITLARSSLVEQSSGYLKLYAYTVTNAACDEIYHYMELQRWNGTDWITYYTTYAYDYDIPDFANAAYKNVAHGYYYRLRTVHNAWFNSENASKTLYTDYIYVS